MREALEAALHQEFWQVGTPKFKGCICFTSMIGGGLFGSGEPGTDAAVGGPSYPSNMSQETFVTQPRQVRWVMGRQGRHKMWNIRLAIHSFPTCRKSLEYGALS
jgi:hypothetical protein